MSSIRSLLSKFEPTAKEAAAPAVAARDRFKSTLDGPRATLSVEAEAARAKSRAALSPQTSSATASVTPTESRITEHALRKTKALPTINVSDNEEVASLKRAIIARDQEIRDANARLHDLAQKLEKLVDQFSSSVVADDFTRSVQLAPEPSSSTMPGTPSASASGSTVGRSPSSILDNSVDANDKSAGNNFRPQRMSATANAPTSLEAILAAARGTTSRPGASDRPKYAKMLRDLK